MLKIILDILKLREYKGTSRELDIACGKYELPLTFKEAWKSVKRRNGW